MRCSLPTSATSELSWDMTANKSSSTSRPPIGTLSMVADTQSHDGTMKFILRVSHVVKMGKKIRRLEFSGTFIGIMSFSLGIQRDFFGSLDKLVASGHVTEFFNVAVQELADAGVE